MSKLQQAEQTGDSNAAYIAHRDYKDARQKMTMMVEGSRDGTGIVVKWPAEAFDLFRPWLE